MRTVRLCLYLLKHFSGARILLSCHPLALVNGADGEPAKKRGILHSLACWGAMQCADCELAMCWTAASRSREARVAPDPVEVLGRDGAPAFPITIRWYLGAKLISCGLQPSARETRRDVIANIRCLLRKCGTESRCSHLLS